MQTKTVALAAFASALMLIAWQPGREDSGSEPFLLAQTAPQQAAPLTNGDPCRFGPYLVLFDLGASDIAPEAADVLDQAASGFANCGRPEIVLAGHADRSGPAELNLALSKSRVAQVASYLRERGIPAEMVTLTWFGEARPRVPTADNEPHMANRRVEITSRADAGL